MLWPEGSQGIVAGIGSYLDPPLPDERIRAFSVSKASSFLAVASAHIVALFRLKPITPLAIYPELFPDTEIKDIVASPRGDNLAVLTADNRISVFSVKPRHDIEEVLRLTSIVTPGFGEAIGARELWLDPVGSIYTEHETLSLDALGQLLVVYGPHEVQVTTWHSFEERDPLKPPALTPHYVESLEDNDNIVRGVSGPLGKTDWISCVLTNNGRAITLSWSCVDATKKIEFQIKERIIQGTEGKITAVDYNPRLCKLALVNEVGKVSVVRDVTDPESKLIDNSSDGGRVPLSVQWTAAGTALLVGYADGWKLLTMLGLELYNHRERSSESGELVGIAKAEWLVSAEVVVLLGTDGRIRLQNMLRWSGLAGTERYRPVLHGNGRLMLYHDPTLRGISTSDGPISQSWLTVPLPTWYMAQNWPIAHVCSSPDGRYVAVAGAIGIMLFSVATRQWKEIGDRDSMVRGGLCWHGRRLVAATVSADDGFTLLKMFSPVSGSNSKQSSHGGGHSGGSGGLFGSQFLTSKTNNTQRESFSGASGNGNGLTVPGSSPGQKLERRLSAQDLLNEGLHESFDVTASAAAASGTNSSSLNSTRGSVAGSDLVASPNTAVSPSSPLITASPSTVSMVGMGGNVSEQQVVAKDVLGKAQGSLVSLMVKGPRGLLGVLAGRDMQRLLIYDLSNIEFDLIKDMPLAGVLAGMPAPSVVRAITLISESQILVLVGTTLLFVSSVGEDSRKYQRQVVADPIESFEYMPGEGQLWVFDGQEAVVTKWFPGQHELPPDMQRKYVASIPLDAYPVHYSPHRGVISLIEADPIRSYDGSFTVSRTSSTHEVYVPYVLEAALVPDFPSALEIARKYSKVPYFAGILETLLYRAVTNDDDAGETRLAMKIIREFPEQNVEGIVARCARKVEMKYWPCLFEAVGKQPAQLFDECLAKSDLETANEFLIVVQTATKEMTPLSNDHGPGESTETFLITGRVLDLYRAASSADQLWICRQLCEFIMAVDPSGKLLRELKSLITA